MKIKKIKIDDLSSKFALTNEQLLEYLISNDIEIFSENDDIDLSDKKVTALLERLNATNKKNHKNKSGLKSIKIEGLFGKYNYHFNFEKDISIWISENGVGKTTILTIIVAILTGDVRTLYDINFQKILVNISDENYVIDKQKPTKLFRDEEKNRKLLMYLLEDLEEDLPENFVIKIKREILGKGYINPSVLEEIIHRLRYYERFNNDKKKQIIRKINDLQYSYLYDEIYKIKYKLNEEIVFYPTYRRVEVGFERVFADSSRKYVNRELTTKYMGFGMSDVKKRIHNLLEKLRRDANAAYIRMNANIISELLANNVRSYIDYSDNIDVHKVEVVIKRIGEDRIDNIDKLKPFLTDKKLSKFAQVCSKYLSEKKIEYDETMLTMDILDSEGLKIDFNDLSSGEKQIVSIFSKVYLDVTPSCIFIIDEPEISLSIEWQKEFLRDIYNSEKVALLIATTHSPFIFKNEYVDYVKELETYKENIDVAKR